jgi:DNA-binding transcriptional LysR family regulator
MSRELPPVSTEQVRAFVELAQTGSVRRAAEALHLSEEGLRSRVLSLEKRMGVELYKKERGRHANVQLTQAGQALLGKATHFIQDARALTQIFDPGQQTRELRIAASQYFTDYLLIDIVKIFHDKFPDVAIRIVTRTEQQILADMQEDTSLTLGICCPAEFPTSLHYQHWFSMDWHFVASRHHPLQQQPNLTLSELCDQPLIIFESESTGRQHVLEAFYQQGLRPRVVIEATSTLSVLRMVEAGIGVAIVPLLPSRSIMRGREIGFVSLGDQIRPLESGIFFRPESDASNYAPEFSSILLAFQP